MAITRDYIGTYRKRPTAKEPVAIDFRDRIPSGENPVSYEVTAEDQDGNLVTGTIVAIATLRGSRVIALLQQGLNATDYYVHYAIICSNAARLEDSIKLEVRA